MALINKEPYITPDMISAWNDAINNRIRQFDIGYANDYSANGTKSIYEICKDALLNCPVGQKNGQILFSLTSGNLPKDIPSGDVWKYSWGYARFRHYPSATGNNVCIIVLYGFDSSTIAIKKILNNVDQGWKYLSFT